MKIHSKISCAAIALATVTSGALAEQPKTFRERMAGVQFGVGMPLVTPLTGYNVFVGYVNKNASTFLGRRFGFRADFTIPSNLRLNGTISDSTTKDGYDVDFYGKAMGFDIKLSDFSDKKIEIDAIKDDTKSPVKIGQDAASMNLEIHNQNIGLLVDFYPFGDTWFLGGFRFSGGYYIGDLSVSANAVINNDIDYKYKTGHGNDYIHAQIAKGSLIGAEYKWKYHGPYAGFGFDLGIWRGIKFYMDAGVVFANAPKVSDANIHDQDFVINGCYAVNGQECSNEMVELMHGANEPNVEQIVHDTVGSAVRNTLNNEATKYSNVIAQIPGFSGLDSSAFGDDIVNFLNGTKTADWINTLRAENVNSDLYNTIEDIRGEWKANVKEATDGIQKDVNQAWKDYEKEKSDAIKDANDFLDDLGVMPMVKIGFMYRF